jgi:predicted site-specific integrase-resolvase
MGPVQVAERLGVKPQLIINWIREGRAQPRAVDGLGRLRFTNQDVEELRAGLGRRRDRPGSELPSGSEVRPKPG